MHYYRELVSATQGWERSGSPVGALLQRWSHAAHHILVNASSLIGTAAVTSGLGFVFWWLAARRFPPEAVGFAAAAVSAITLLGTISMLGLGTLLMGELPRQPGQEWPLITAALAVVGTMGAILGLLAAVALPAVSRGLRPLAGSIGNTGLFALGVSLTAVALVLDDAMIGLLRGQWRFGRNVIFAVTKLAALAVAGLGLVGRLGLTIYATWVFGIVVSLVGLAVLAGRSHGGVLRRPQWQILSSLGRMALAHHGLNLALNIAALALPLVVSTLLSVTANAYFYAASMIASFAAVVPIALAISLYAASAAAPATLTHRIRLTFGLAMAINLLTSLALWIGARRILGIYGPAYATHAGWSLRILSLAVFPVTVKVHYVAIRRIHRRVIGAAYAMTAGGLLEVAMGAVGARIGGLQGLSVGWVIALCVEAILTAPIVYRVVVPPAVSADKTTVERFESVRREPPCEQAFG